MQKKQLSVLVLIILCFLLGCNRETPKDESQQNYEDESNISKTNGEELVNINSELLGSTPFDIQIDKTALQTRKETETEVTIKTNLTDWGYTVSSEKGKISDINKEVLKYLENKGVKIFIVTGRTYISAKPFAGVRYEHNSTYGSEWVPQAGFTWRPFGGNSIKASFSKGFRSPGRRIPAPHTAFHSARRGKTT
mgnify:CR=1 FL=1